MKPDVLNVLDAILDQQKKAWLDGSQPSVEDLIRGSSLPRDPETLLDLIYNEIVLREELGEFPTLEEYVQRYPQLQEDLQLHFEVHRALQQNELVDTRRIHDADSVQEIAASSLEVGPKLTDYTIVGELGRGGMGIVYKARHHRLKRLVAIKMFQPGRIPSPREQARFRAESEAIARLQHPNIVQIFEVGQEQGLPFLALELAEHGTLAQRLQELPFAPRAAAELIATLARAIQHAHDRQIVHRDLKPGNVLFAKDGTPKITDFGLAKMLEDETDSPRDATRSGEPIGTPRYMAPEQAAGQQKAVGPATDVYALGTLLYECLTGQVPFVSASVVETMEKIRHEEPPPPRRVQPSIPRDLETICLHCLHKLPDRRYASAGDLAADLQRFLNGEPIRARPVPAWERAWKWCRRRPTHAALLTAGFGFLFACLVVFFVRQHRLARLEEEAAGLVRDGLQAMQQEDYQTSEAKFDKALAIIQAESALRHHELAVRGWWDQSRRGSQGQHGKQRRLPGDAEVRRDEALVQIVLFDPLAKEPDWTARNVIETALEFVVRPADREELLLVDADLALRAGEPAKALLLLEPDRRLASRLLHDRRADCLERLGDHPAAERERAEALKFPPNDGLQAFLSGMGRFQHADLDGAVRDFDRVLAFEPRHFASRFCQAVCLLRLKRSAEAKVALTACLLQRSTFVECYLLRSQAYLQMGDPAVAAQDLQRAHEMQLNASARRSLDRALVALQDAVAELPRDAQNAFWNTQIRTQVGRIPVRDLPVLRKIAAPL